MKNNRFANELHTPVGEQNVATAGVKALGFVGVQDVLTSPYPGFQTVAVRCEKNYCGK